MNKITLDRNQLNELLELSDDILILEGCLLDSYLIQLEGKDLLILEEYVNCWTSKNVLILEPTPNMLHEFYKEWKESNNDN